MYSLKIKKLSSIVILLAVSPLVFADGGIMMQSQKGGFNVGIDALYFRASVNNLNYAILENFAFVSGENFFSGTENEAVKTINPTYDFGFRIQVGYWIPCTCYDLNLAYTHLNVSNNASIEIPDINDEFSEISIQPAGFDGNGAIGKTEVDLNMVDLDAGRHLSGNNYDIRLFAGLRYANINRDTDIEIKPFPADPEFIEEINANEQIHSHFKGIGPRIGAQGRYGQYCGWGLDADVSIAVLLGQIDSHYKEFDKTVFGDGFVDTEEYTRYEPKNGIAVPVCEAKLGVDYTYRFNCNRDAVLVFEAGYQTTSYFDGINSATYDTSMFLSSRTNNVTFNGPYLGVKYYA